MLFRSPEISSTFNISDFSFIQVTEKVFNTYSKCKRIKEPPQRINGDIIVMVTNESDILTGVFSFTKENLCNIKLQNVYKGQSIKNIQTGGIVSFYVDLVTDKILTASFNGVINSIDRTILRILHPQKAQIIDQEEKKEKSWKDKIGFMWFDINQGVVPIIKMRRSERSVKEELKQAPNQANATNFTVMAINHEDSVIKPSTDQKIELHKKNDQ